MDKTYRNFHLQQGVSTCSLIFATIADFTSTQIKKLLDLSLLLQSKFCRVIWKNQYRITVYDLDFYKNVYTAKSSSNGGKDWTKATNEW